MSRPNHQSGQHVEEDVEDVGRVVQEGVGEQPPDFAVKEDLIDVEEQGVGEGVAGEHLDEEDDDVDADQPFADRATFDERPQETGAFAADVIAVVDTHDRPLRRPGNGLRGSPGGGVVLFLFTTWGRLGKRPSDERRPAVNGGATRESPVNGAGTRVAWFTGLRP